MYICVLKKKEHINKKKRINKIYVLTPYQDVLIFSIFVNIKNDWTNDCSGKL